MCAHTRTGLPAGVGWVEKDTKANTGMKNAHTVWGGGYLRGEVLATEGSSLATLGEFHGRHHVPGEIGVPSLELVSERIYKQAVGRPWEILLEFERKQRHCLKCQLGRGARRGRREATP